MAWVPRGLIFDVKAWSGSPAVGSFAQSPQALVLDDRVRVFFSTRYKEGPGPAWRSEVSFVEYSRDFQEVLNPPQGNVIGRACLGAFDEHGIFPFSVVPVDGEVWAYTTGWSRRKSVSVETGIGLAKSRDGGLTFVRHGNGPILSTSLNEPFLVCDAFVRRIEGRWFMWYLFGTGWSVDEQSGIAERTYKIGVAKSTDGLSWQSSNGVQAIPDVLGPLESQALPSVALVDGYLQMVFCFRETFGFRSNSKRGYRLGYAKSQDGISWTRDDSVVEFSGLGFDVDMRCYPHLVQVGSRLFLLYNGNEFGREGFGLAEWRP